MPQRKPITWSELRVGLFVLAGLIIVAVAIFYVTGTNFWGPKYTIKTYLPEVADLQVGAPVSLDGVTVGNVSDIRINPHPSDKMHSIQVDMKIQKRFQDLIRADSEASLVTQGLLGNRYVAVVRGKGPIVQDGGTIPGVQASDIQQIVTQGVNLEAKLTQVTTDLGSIVGSIRNGQGSVGKFIYDPALYNHLDATAAHIDELVATVKQGKGSVGKLVASDELYNKLNASMTHVQSVTAAIDSQQGTLGKLVYDPKVYNEFDTFLSHGNALISGVQQGKGTVGKLFTDDSLFANLRDASANIRDVTGKLNNGQGTFGKFFTDPQLYDNMTGLTGDMRLLIGDFRRNPKKFLSIKLHIF